MRESCLALPLAGWPADLGVCEVAGVRGGGAEPVSVVCTVSPPSLPRFWLVDDRLMRDSERGNGKSVGLPLSSSTVTGLGTT